MPEPLRVLEALGDEFERLQARPAPRRRLPRALVLGAAVLLGVGGVAGATSYVLTGSPIPGADERDVPLDQRLEPGTARLAGAEADDPAGGPRWDLRVSRSETGELCTAVGQVHEGVFGLVGMDGRFRELPLQGVDACGSDPAGRPAFVGAREFAAERPEDVVTVLNGVGGEALEDVRVDAGGREHDVARGGGGTFVAVLRGTVAQVQPTVTLRFAGGARREYRFGQTRYAEFPDPEGGRPWTVRAGARPDGRTCASARPARMLGPLALTPPVCGRLRDDHVFFDVRPMVRAGAPYSWDLGPRTLIWGAADETVERVEVVHRGERIAAARTEADAGFVAVLPGGTRPAEVEVTAVFEDGRRVSGRGAVNLRGAGGERLERPLQEPPPAPPERPGPEAFERAMRPVPGSGRIARRAPLAGLEVALRTFDTAGGGRCAELGWLAPDGSFGARRRDGGVRPRELGARGGTCGEHGPSHTWGLLLDDGSAYDPRVIGTVVWGHTRERPVRIEGLARDVTVQPDDDGLFLAVSGQTELPSGGVGPREGRNPGFRRDPVVPGSVRVVARAPDPAGLQPYGVMRWEQRPGVTCSYEGQLVGDMAGAVSPDPGIFMPFPMHEGGSCGGGPAGDFPVSFGVSSAAADESEVRTPTQIARRTLAGRTIVSGEAGAGVARVVLQTPRDVRTFRPGPGGAFLVVLDGTFATGDVTVTAVMADGRTLRRTIELDR